MAMGFEQYTRLCAGRRPSRPDWFSQVVHAALGLVAAATSLLDHLRTHGATDMLSSECQDLLEEFEWCRALVYLEFDQRPVPVPATGASPQRPAEVAMQVALAAGRVANVVNEWMFEGHWLGAQLEGMLADLDVARASLHVALGVDEQRIWARTGRRAVPPIVRKAGIHTRPDSETPSMPSPAPLSLTVPATVLAAVARRGAGSLALSPCRETAPGLPRESVASRLGTERPASCLHLVRGNRCGHGRAEA